MSQNRKIKEQNKSNNDGHSRMLGSKTTEHSPRKWQALDKLFTERMNQVHAHYTVTA